jgi:tetratricopeptide (TPR) repeat protein
LRLVNLCAFLKRVNLFVLMVLLAGCSLEKESGVNRALQNLTARYNIVFNANELLKQKQEDYALSFVDAYDQLLSVYQDTTYVGDKTDKDLEEVIAKANKIISIKEQSNYIGDAYMMLGKANYLGGNYFNAVEYFNYVIRSYPQKTDLVQEARIWKARGLLYLNNQAEAKLVLDTALQNIDAKKSIAAHIYATRLQYAIDVQDFAAAEEMAANAVALSNNKRDRLRWTFILAQLQELNRKPAEAYNNYSRIVASNASFEMAFNANLNRIRIGDAKNGKKLTRVDGLRRLLKDDKNQDFIDQVYYHIAELYLADNDIESAIKNYKLSLNYSNKNLTQKGLTYLRLADISFKNKADYVNAKKYYDSTLVSLSPNYPGYTAIQKKSNNLQLLADRLQIIAHEDTLQMLARLDEQNRLKRIDEMVNSRILKEEAAVVDNSANMNTSGSNAVASTPTGSKFYFYNANAVSQGFTDFKRKWGNRRLEDNWRRSRRANADLAVAQNPNQDIASDPFQKTPENVNAGAYRQELLQNLPLTAQQLSLSNTRVYNAYLDMANFYRDVLDDKKEAIAIYELMLSRFPDDQNKAAMHYNLYRLYTDIDKVRSDEYKNSLLKNYPSTPFARVISDPAYGQGENGDGTEFNGLYNQVYELLAQKKYTEAIIQADQLLLQYPNNKLAAQLYYLRAIAAGHQQKLTLFQADLQQIATTFPDDRLVTPLVVQHLAYISANQAEMALRPFALVDNDPSQLGFVPQIIQQPVLTYPGSAAVKTAPQMQKTVPKHPEDTPPVITQQVVVTNPVKTEDPIISADPYAQPAPAESSIFSMSDSTNYYFVVNVNTGTTNLSSSRFGIGQYNRANYQANTIRHQLKNAGPDNQLIYVGRFSNLDAAKQYARAIIPLMPQIMKVPTDKYSFFVITQENLNKLADRKTLDSYIDYYQKNY